MKNRVGEDILSVLDEASFDSTDRNLISMFLHEVVFDNQRAVYDLIKLNHIGSASALLRVIFEAHVKALWVSFCATENEINDFKKDKVKSRNSSKNSKSLQEMISEIETEKPDLNNSLSRFKSNHWKGLNSLTHSGSSQFRFRLKNNEMSKNYDKSYIQELLSFAKRFAINSLTHVGDITGSARISYCSILLLKEELGISL